MDIWDEIKKLTGYQSGNGGVDSYGVDHSGFSTRDELEYQSARLARENQLAENFSKQRITEENYPQFGTNFWGGTPENNYGFGTSNIRQNIENVTNQLNNNANNGQITTNSDYTINTESLVGKPSSYFQNNNTSGSATGRAIENVAGAVTAPNTTLYVTQNAYTPSPTYGASKATGYQIQTPSAFASQPTNQSTNIAPNTTSSPIMEPINRYLASVSPQYTAPTSLGQSNSNQARNIKPQEIHKKIFNGVDCGGMSPEFADKIAYAESMGGCRDNINDYGCVNNSASAFGRYQMQIPALKDAGYIDNKGNFLPETGINNMQEFLNNPEAQEQAMCNYLDRIDQYNKNWNNYKYLGKNIQVGNLNIPITKDMMLAGTHREGARKLNEWLNDVRVRNNNLVRNSIYD